MGKRNIPTCPYCLGPATWHEKSDHVYGRDYGPIWHCAPCEAWVGCHKGSREPLGRLANKALRRAKQAAHASFDPMWQAKMARFGIAKHSARGDGYRWLAEQMGLRVEDCHIGMMDESQCARVVEICSQYKVGRSA